MILLSFSDFIGRFHPLLVHLPIGILLLGVLLHWYSSRSGYENLAPAIKVTLLLGAFSAVASCISGWLLAGSGEYDVTTLDRHRWMGIGVAVISVVYYVLYAKKLSIKITSPVLYSISILTVLLLMITGHLGGTLTHGEGYLTSSLESDEGPSKQVKKVIPDVQQAVAYSDIIQPVLQNKCYSCHGASKQKGKLRLDTPESIGKGGEGGRVLVAGKADDSELFERLLLDETDKKHMPPKGKPQLTESEIALMHWWINNGANFDAKVATIQQDEKIKPLLLALQSDAVSATPSKPDVPSEAVAAASQETIAKLKAAGVTVIPVAKESNYLSVNFVSAPAVTEAEMKLLEAIAPQLVWLKLGSSPIGDNEMASIAKLTSLTRLHLDRTKITDKGIAQLKTLNKLQYLNIVGTEVTLNGLTALKELSELQTVYIYQTKITGADSAAIKKAFPKTVLDTGGYVLPILEGDTSEIKQKPN